MTRKLAEQLDGVDVSHNKPGDILEVAPRDAALLLAEGWAEPFVERRREVRGGAPVEQPLAADQALSRRTIEQLRRVRDRFEQRRQEQHESRRSEDRIREELQDERARIVKPERGSESKPWEIW